VTPPTSPRGREILSQDLPLALLVASLVLVGFGVSLEDDFQVAVTGDGRWPLPDIGGVLLLLAESMALTFRRVAPAAVLAFNALASLVYQALDHRPLPLTLPLLVAIYTVAVRRRPLVSGIGAAAYMVVCTLGAVTGWAPLTDDQYYTVLVSVVGAVMTGYGVALGRARATLAEQQVITLARDQQARMSAAVEQEQARIAREVHDIVAHDVSVIVAQAAVTRRVFPTQPQKAVEALASIESLGRDALDGLRRLVGLVRSPHPEDGDSPQPTLERLPSLLAQVRLAGLPVDLTIRGTPRPLPVTVELNAFRIVQEALTNSLKHAGPTRATVVLDYRGDSLDVEVRDGGLGRPPAVPSAGFGLIGMQQRAAMLGGELVAGPTDGQGFRVSARLPLAESTA
jgi:signal transduction histidine kinase